MSPSWKTHSLSVNMPLILSTVLVDDIEDADMDLDEDETVEESKETSQEESVEPAEHLDDLNALIADTKSIFLLFRKG